MSLELKSLNRKKVGFFRFKDLNGRYLITNDIGKYSSLSPYEFDSFLLGKIEQEYPDKYSELKSKYFLRDQLNLETLTNEYAAKNTFLGQGPCLHIIVVTARCDHRCLYCQTSSRGLKATGIDMDIPTAQKVVDIIFHSPSKYITIEFQGGEPLVNWDAVKFIVEYAQKKNKLAKKALLFSLVSNFSFMTKERVDFLIKHNVSVCTSLDGPEKLHIRNRITSGKINSYKNTVKWVKIINKKIKNSKKYKFKINALTTITKFSLPYHRQIVDKFIALGLKSIFLRPVNPFGLNKSTWKKISLPAKEFLDFYTKTLDYMIKLNFKGKKIHEVTAKLFLTKILTEKNPNYMDMRSPCGAGIGQIAYNFNGDVYTCDEARMLAAVGDDIFRIGNVNNSTYKELMDNEVVKTMCLASCLDNLPVCSECVYKPYCGVCPVYNYAVEGNIFSQATCNERCLIQNGILDYIFKKLETEKNKEVFLKWLKDT